MDETTHYLPAADYNELIERLWNPEVTEVGYSRREHIAMVLAEANIMTEAHRESDS